MPSKHMEAVYEGAHKRRVAGKQITAAQWLDFRRALVGSNVGDRLFVEAHIGFFATDKKCLRAGPLVRRRLASKLAIEREAALVAYFMLRGADWPGEAEKMIGDPDPGVRKMARYIMGTSRKHQGPRASK